MAGFATVDDLTKLWRPMTKEEQNRAEALLEVVSAALQVEADKVGNRQFKKQHHFEGTEMIEITIKAYLTAQLPVAVYMEFPSEPPERFVILDRTNTSRENHILASTFAAQSYAESKLEAAELNELVKLAMDMLIELDEVSSSQLNSDYPFPDTTRKLHRYQAVYDVTHY